ncbi:hypothetical protein AB0X98_01205 [Rothia koreensis]|uniref:hypothetical protein n=1 Tax=Rothia koreensis TaxID=592378 RepID=UPI003F23C39C
MDPKIEEAYASMNIPFLLRPTWKKVLHNAQEAIAPKEEVVAVGTGSATPLIILTDSRILTVWKNRSHSVSLPQLINLTEKPGKWLKAKGPKTSFKMVRDSSQPKSLWIAPQIAQALAQYQN